MKKCKYCNESYPEESFPTAGIIKGKLYRRSKCSKCYVAMKCKRRDSIKEWFEDYKKGVSCQECGRADHRVIDFHHKDANKEECVSVMVCHACSKEKILAEIGKCIPLCACCHRILHYENNRV